MCIRDSFHFFKKSEDFRIDELYSEPDFAEHHSTGGYLKVEDYASNKNVVELKQYLSNAFKEFGLNTYNDVNNRYDTGFFRTQGTFYNACLLYTSLTLSINSMLFLML